LDLGTEFLFGFDHAGVTHGLALTGVGGELCAIDGDMSQAHHSGTLAELDALLEHAAKRLAVPEAEVIDRPEIGL
jgi:hypothetical protein